MPESASAPLQPIIPSILKTILADKKMRLQECKGRSAISELKRRCRDLPPPRDFRTALNPAATGSSDTGIAIIAEFKRRSPSRGVIHPDFDLNRIHEAYAASGADAYSVLTEEDHFGGSLRDLTTLRKLARVPLLRKDFLFDPYQIYQSRAAGADALLLIVSALAYQPLSELIALSRELGMEALVEVHDREELSRALECGAAVVGINNRNLHSFEVDLDVSLQLAADIPKDITVVSESGIHGAADIRRLLAAGVHAFLVGEHLMRAKDPAAALRRLKEAV